MNAIKTNNTRKVGDSLLQSIVCNECGKMTKIFIALYGHTVTVTRCEHCGERVVHDIEVDVPHLFDGICDHVKILVIEPKSSKSGGAA